MYAIHRPVVTTQSQRTNDNVANAFTYVGGKSAPTQSARERRTEMSNASAFNPARTMNVIFSQNAWL